MAVHDGQELEELPGLVGPEAEVAGQVVRTLEPPAEECTELVPADSSQEEAYGSGYQDSHADAAVG